MEKPSAEQRTRKVLKELPRVQAPGFGLPQALAGVLPTVIGALFAGDTGAAVGADVGLKAMGQLTDAQVQAANLAAEQRKQDLSLLSDAISRDVSLDNPLELARLNVAQGNLQLRERELGALENARAQREVKDESRQITDVVKSYNKDPIVLESQKSIGKAQNAKEMLKLNNPISAAVVKRALARMSGEVGVMTDKDVESFAGSKKWTDQMEQLYQQASRGTLTDTNKKYMLEIIDNMEKIERQKLQERTDVLTKQFGASTGKEEKVKSAISAMPAKEDKVSKLKSLLGK